MESDNAICSLGELDLNGPTVKKISAATTT